MNHRGSLIRGSLIMEATAGYVSPLAGIGRLIETIGTPDFAPGFANLLHEMSGADFVSLFQIHAEGARVLGAYDFDRPRFAREHALRYVSGRHWLHDPALADDKNRANRAETEIIRIDPMRIDDVVLKRDFYRRARIGDKLALVVRRDDSLFVASMLHTLDSGLFENAAVDRVSLLADLLMATLARHATLESSSTASLTLADVGEIEARLNIAAGYIAQWRLTRRERQVCARVLFGMIATGIALDLGINESSVDTYRKRAYRRLGIGTRHELLRRYLALDLRSAANLK